MQEDVGSHCSFAYCKQLDFLPFLCNGCGRLFCRIHRRPDDHKCSAASTAIAEETVICRRCRRCIRVPATMTPDEALEQHQAKDCPGERVASVCAVSGCSAPVKVFTTCPSCNRVVCIKHRFPDDHDCPAATKVKPTGGAAPQRKQGAPKAAASAPSASSGQPKKQVSDKHRALANKVERMKVKQKATGDAAIPSHHRIAVRVLTSPSVSVPAATGKGPFFVWLDGSKTIGYNLDYICLRLKVRNPNADGGGHQRLVVLHGDAADKGEELLERYVGGDESAVCVLSGLCSEGVESGDVIVLHLVTT